MTFYHRKKGFDMALPLSKLKKRTIVMFVCVAVLLVALIFRVGYWQLYRGEELSGLAIDQQTRQTIVNANRGTIYDRNGKAIAQSASVNTVVCNPQDIKKSGSAELVASKIAPILSMEYDKVYSLLTKSNRYQVIKKRVTLEETQAIKDLKDTSKYTNLSKEDAKKEVTKYVGVYFEEDTKRYYSYNIAPHVIGFTGYDNDGRQGIEMTFDDELTGRVGSVLSAQSASGTNMKLQYEQQLEAEKGADVVLTLDETIQHFLEKHLETAVVENQLKEGAAGIIMNPKTGEILAMATKPDFNVNDPYSTTQFEDLAKQVKTAVDETPTPSTSPETTSSPESANDNAVAAVRNKMWRNKAISDTYEPGSTFKILTAAMALEENVVTLNSPFYCGGSMKVADRTIRCHKAGGHGSQTFLQGVQNSCNPVFMELGLRTGGEKFMDYFKAFGLTQKTGIELIGESDSVYYKKDKLSDVDVATSAFGQGNSITPLQLITAVSAVINGGDLMKPQIVKEIRNDNGVIKTYQAEVKNKVISKQTSDTMREILESVVGSPTGTGKNAYIKGYRIGGKTGTSEKGRNNNKRIASFVGFAPADDPEIICLVMMDEPQAAVKYGGTIAAPVVGSIIEETLEYLGVERQFTAEEMKQMALSVPEVRGMSIAEAKNQIATQNLKVTVKGDGETIVDQLPKPGSSITANSNVILYTTEADTNTLVTVPDVTGVSMSEAKSRLLNAGLNFEVIGAGLATNNDAYASKQSIAPGEKVAPATIVGVEFRHTSSD